MACVYLLVFRCCDHVDMCDVQYNTHHTNFLCFSEWNGLAVDQSYNSKRVTCYSIYEYVSNKSANATVTALSSFHCLVCRDLCVPMFYTTCTYNYVDHCVLSDTLCITDHVFAVICCTCTCSQKHVNVMSE